jgi:choice-of-anchor A domain-containing protein
VNSNGAAILGSLSNATINSGTAAVLGSASGTNFNGAAYVAGGSAGNNYNGGTLSSLPATVAAATSSDFASTLKALSASLSLLASTGSSVTISGGKATFNAVANADGLAVFDLTASDTQLFALSEFSFKLNGAKTVIFNVDATSLEFSINFLAGSATQLASNSLWNFYNATSLTVYSQFGGSILAPLATLTNYQNIEGEVLVGSLTQHGEIHATAFTGDVSSVSAVPEPASYALMLGGLALLAAIARRRRA